jgi:hypothetical protein
MMTISPVLLRPARRVSTRCTMRARTRMLLHGSLSAPLSHLCILRRKTRPLPNTSSASLTQLLHEPPPPLPSDRESDFEPPPKWTNTSTTSARESLRSLFTHALRDPGDTPRKDARRNSIDSSEAEDSPRNDRVIQERARNKGKRMSFSDEELDKSSSSRSFGIRSPVDLELNFLRH